MTLIYLRKIFYFEAYFSKVKEERSIVLQEPFIKIQTYFNLLLKQTFNLIIKFIFYLKTYFN